MADYNQKSAVLNDYPFLLEEHKKVSKVFYDYTTFYQLGVVPKKYVGFDSFSIKDAIEWDYENAQRTNQYNLEHYGSKWLEAGRIVSNDYCRKNRLVKRTKSICENENYSYFLTFTFNDDYFNKTTEDTRRQVVRRTLKDLANGLDYVGNIDFGEDPNCSHREHYHAILNTTLSKIDGKIWQKKGWLHIERIRTDNATPERLAKYVSKLSNHAVKETARRSHLIYSRRKKEK